MQNPEDAPIPMIGVGAVIFNSYGAVLMIRRNKQPALGLWSVPGGCLEPGESLVNACRRETLEETGLEVNVKNILAVVERRFTHFHYIIVDFLAELAPEAKSDPVASTDVSDARWIMLEELIDYPLVVGLEEIIRKAHHAYCRGIESGLHDGQGLETDFILCAGADGM